MKKDPASTLMTRYNRGAQTFGGAGHIIVYFCYERKRWTNKKALSPKEYQRSVALLRMVAPGAGLRGVTLFWSRNR